MSKIIGVTVGTTLPKPNFNQEDPTKGDYIKNKPDFDGLKSKVEQIEVRVDNMQESAYDDTELRGIVSENIAKIDTLNELVGNTNVATQIGNAVTTLEFEIDGKLDTMQSDIDSKVDAVDGMGLSTNDYTTAEKDKLSTVEANANFYEHPVHTSHSSGLYKITVDDSGHVSGATLAEKDDIVALGIPAQDTVYDDSELRNRIAEAENDIDSINRETGTIKADYLKSSDKQQLQDDIKQVSDKATENENAIAILNGDSEKEGSVKQSIDSAFTDFTTNVIVGINNRIGTVESDFSEYKTSVSDQFNGFSDTVNGIDERVGKVEAEFSSYKDDISGQFSEVNQTILEHNHDDLYYDKDEILGLITVEDIDDICESNISSGEDIDVVSVATKYWVEQFYQPKGSYLTETDINNHNTSTSSHNDIRKLIEDLSKDLYTLADCDDETLDQMHEVVDYIKNNNSLIEGITTNKVNISDIINDLTTNVSNKPLSAAQGVALKQLIDKLQEEVDGKIVETDETLSKECVAADAKAVGDALAGKASVSDIDEATTIDAALTVQLGANGTIGGYKTGDVIAEGTSVVTILNKLLRKAVPATYTNPKVTLAAQNTAAGSHEYGTNITAQVKATFTKNDAGAMQSISILKDGVEILTGTSNTLTSDAETFKLTSTVSYTASATYAEGTIKNDNLGDPSPSGHIAAGTVTSSAVTFTPYRQGYFYGVLATDKTTPLTSEIIRGCNKKGGAYAAGNLPLISASSVDNRKRIFVACPATSKGVTKVVMPSAQGADATKDFVKQSSTVTVEGANGTTGIAYNVWVYEPALISDDQTFTVTLG